MLNRTRRLSVAACSALAILAGATLSACSSSDSAASGDSSNLNIVATTGYLADAVRNVAPDATVTTIVGPGGDPHTYQPSTQDINQLREADLVLWTGLHLEHQMETQLESLGDSQLAVGEKIEHSRLLPWEDDGTFDPHIWNSPDIWRDVVTEIGQKLAEIDPDNAADYTAAAKDYGEKITAAKEKAAAELKDANPRVLISGHDAFNYFGRTFDFEIHATDFVTTDAALSPTEISKLADTIATKRVPVIFQDNQANPQAIQALKEAVQSRGWNVEISDAELFADTLGATAPTDTYLGVFEYNAHAIAQALNG
ncbi:zinc ABC transporter substrate-binding protein [Corynebacterium lizhenjunii]|uniref:Zinc ABC transporter substrate-binding protein n=1 Tax=Corynebacterium lizhenjunii TaxID=2709394 RepID=A0A7T0KFK4_9CORY|nr:zinc ABC transporter substrate-binding protein [Corynebacterium lizhenjunii]QPK79436.1 zinc ABC transporter substrate-binding protein [Corynebacterium lizhenjunii]